MEPIRIPIVIDLSIEINGKKEGDEMENFTEGRPVIFESTIRAARENAKRMEHNVLPTMSRPLLTGGEKAKKTKLASDMLKSGSTVTDVVNATGLTVGQVAYVKQLIKIGKEPSTSNRIAHGDKDGMNARVEDFWKRYSNGEKLKDIAASYGISYAQGKAYIRMAKSKYSGTGQKPVINKLSPLTSEAEKRIVDLYKQGKSVKEIREATGMKKTTVHYVVYQKYGLAGKSNLSKIVNGASVT